MASSQRPFNTPSSAREPLLKRIFTIRLSVTGLIGTTIALILGVGWVFAFGVIVGRGFNPEQKMPGLGRLASTQTQTAPEDNTIIKAEDLTFLADLKTKPTLSTEPEQHAAQPAAPGTGATGGGTARSGKPGAHSATAAKPAAGQKAGQTANQPSQTAQTGEKTGEKAGQTNVQAPKPTAQSTRYNYVFQVIAYTRTEQADAFRAKLEDEGLRTRLSIEKGKRTVYRVQVLLRGTEADADAARAIIARMGVKNPSLASKTPVNAR